MKTLIKLENGKKYFGIQYTETNKQEVLDWGEGQIFEKPHVFELEIFNPKDLNSLVYQNDWVVRHGDFIFSYSPKEIEGQFIMDQNTLNVDKSFFDTPQQHHTIKAPLDEFFWRYHQYWRDAFVEELVFQHYVARVKFYGLSEKLEAIVIEILRSLKHKLTLVE